MVPTKGEPLGFLSAPARCVPEPTWLVRPEDLVRPISGEIPRARVGG